MGTFKILLNTSGAIIPGYSTVSPNDNWFCDNSGVFSNPVALINMPSVLNNPDDGGTVDIKMNTAAIASMRFDINGNTIYLDGSLTPIDFAGLPSGFVPLSASVIGSFSISNFGDGATVSIRLQKDAITESSPTVLGPSGDVTLNFPYDFSSFPPTILQILTNGCGFSIVPNHPTTSDFSVQPDFAHTLPALYISGTYEIQSSQFKLNVPQPVSPGDIVSLTSSEPNALDFTKIITLTVGGFDIPSDDWTATEFTFSFPVPDYGSLGILEIVITSTEFSGSLSLGKITTILFLGASGIYKLTNGQAYDTLYDIVNGGTVNVKIPNPFIKTYLAGGK